MYPMEALLPVLEGPRPGVAQHLDVGNRHAGAWEPLLLIGGTSISTHTLVQGRASPSTSTWGTGTQGHGSPCS
jgi:hypothetical protein